MGENKLKKYGKQFLEAITEFQQEKEEKGEKNTVYWDFVESSEGQQYVVMNFAQHGSRMYWHPETKIGYWVWNGSGKPVPAYLPQIHR